MPSTQRTHIHTVGEKPHVGRRYVSDGKVRIEWREGGKRRSRTVGPNTPEVRARADAMLEDLVRPKRRSSKAKVQAARTTPTQQRLPPGDEYVGSTVGDAVRAWAVALMDVADVLVERAETWVSRWMGRKENGKSDGD